MHIHYTNKIVVAEVKNRLNLNFLSLERTLWKKVLSLLCDN